MTGNVLNWPARHPRLALAIALAVALLALSSALRLRPDTSIQSLFSPSDRAATALNRVFTDFPAAEALLVLATTQGDSAQPEQLVAFAQRFRQQLDDDPDASKLIGSFKYEVAQETIEFFKNVAVPKGMFYLSDAEFDAIRQRLTRAEMAEQLRRDEAMIAAPGPAAGALAKTLLKDPLRLREFLIQRLAAARTFKGYEGRSALLSPDGRSLLIQIAGTRPPSDMEFCRRITAAVTRAAERANTDHLTLEFSGAYPIAARSERSIRADSIASINGSILCLAGLFILAFRKPLRLFAVTFAPVALGILYGFGVYALWTRSFTPLTAVIGAVLGGIGIDYSIFYLVHYLERRAAGEARVQAATAATRTISGALVAAWVTSVVGFIAIVFASVPALRDFAVVGSLGLAGALLGTMFLLPALLVLMDGRKKESPHAAGEPRTGEEGIRSPARLSLRPLLAWIDRHSRACLTAGAIVLSLTIISLAIAGPKLGLESDPTVLHPRPNPPLDAERHIAQRMGNSADSLIVHLRAETPEQLLALAHRVNDRLATDQAKGVGVQSAFGLATLLPDPTAAPRRLSQLGPALAEQVVNDFDAALADSSFDPKAYDPYRTFLRILLTPSAPPGITDLLSYRQLAEQFLPRGAFQGRPATEAITLVFLGESMNQREARERCVATLRSLLADCPGATLTGMAVLSLDTESTIRRDLPRLLTAAVVITAAYLLVHFRSVTLAVLAVLPTLCSLTLRLGIARFTGEHLNLANIVSIPLLIGIDVDYGIFLVSVARRTRTRAELLDRAAASCQAVVLCGCSTLLGFGSLAFTSVPAIRSLGWAVAIGVICCSAASLFVLLPVLLWLKDRAAAARVRLGAGSAAVVQLALVAVALVPLGCVIPHEHLSFPQQPIARLDGVEWYDVRHDGTRGFGVGYDDAGNVDRLLYNDPLGSVPRIYRLGDYPNGSVPHVILLLDSIPWETMRERYAAGDFHWFGPPQKMIAPFPSLTEVCYTAVLRAPPLLGIIDQYFDPREQKRQYLALRRAGGYAEPWERRLDYHIGIVGQGVSFIDPDPWYAAELERARRAIEESPDRVPIVYLSSAASMVCKHGRAGAEKVLDGARQLCLQLLYERRGALKISMMADHGHNYTPSVNGSLAEMLKAAGFRVKDRIKSDRDCVIEYNALVTTSGIHTRHPAEVAAALCRHEQVELAIYQEGEQSVIQSARGRAAIECRGGKVRYVPLDADVLDYAPVLDRLKSEGKMDAEGFADDDTWFRATLDHAWPDAPRRVWDALHGRFLNVPDVILSIKDGYYSGYAAYEHFIKMASTHGGLNQVNSATFVMTMTGRLDKPVRHEQLLQTLEPGFEPRVR